MILVGHVTKEGALAGPRVLEHLVDCVLQFEGERERFYRTLRALKNRFGSTNELGVFEMRDSGLVEVRGRQPALRRRGDARARLRRPGRDGGLAAAAGRGPGARVPVGDRAAAADGQRDRPQPARARAGGAGRHGGLGSGTADVFVNVAGGVKIDEPGADLAVALAVASAARGVTLERGGRPLACYGELGLTGELRTVGHADRRPAEARKFGLETVSAPTLRQALGVLRTASAEAV